MFVVCRSYTKNTAEAEDVLHDGFIKIFDKIGMYKGAGSFEGWMRRIFVNTALERYRKMSKIYVVEEVKDTIIEIEEETVSEISEKELLLLINELSPQYKLVFNLYVLENLTHKEISKCLEISEGSSKSNLARARQTLKTKVNNLMVLKKKGNVYGK